MVDPHPALAFAEKVHAQTLAADSDRGPLMFVCNAGQVGEATGKFIGAANSK